MRAARVEFASTSRSPRCPISPTTAIDTVVAQAEQLPAPFGQLILGPMGGALARTDTETMALPVDGGAWTYFCLAMWMDPAEDERNTAWARGFHEAMRPFSGDTAPPNFIAADEGNGTPARVIR